VESIEPVAHDTFFTTWSYTLRNALRPNIDCVT